MNVSAQIARHFREVYFGGNWTSVNLKDVLAEVDWVQATAAVQSFNTIAALVYHTSYYVSAVTKVLQGGALEAKDAYSFDHPPIRSAADWDALLDKTWREAGTFTDLIAALPEDKLWADFTDPKYGTYYRNLQGITEHLHYHLGQIVLIKRLIARDEAATG